MKLGTLDIYEGGGVRIHPAPAEVSIRLLERLLAAAQGAEAAMRDGSSIEPDSASVQVADEGGEGAGSVEDPAPSPAPIEARAEAGLAARPAAGRLPVLAAPPAAPTLPCPECGEWFKPLGLAPHRAKKHGVAGHGRLRPAATNGAPAPVIRKGRETFLCPRCDTSFPTDELRLGHLRKGHPPLPAPSTRPFGEQPVLEPSGGGFRD